MSSKVKVPDIAQSLAEIPPAETQSWAAYLGSLANFRGNIGSLTAPSFIISGTSLTEYSAYWVNCSSFPRSDVRLNTPLFLNTFKMERPKRTERWQS
jgi:hypothetical protein